jgi:hypothetical protein
MIIFIYQIARDYKECFGVNILLYDIYSDPHGITSITVSDTQSG